MNKRIIIIIVIIIVVVIIIIIIIIMTSNIHTPGICSLIRQSNFRKAS